MKKIKFIALAFATLFIVACSSNPAISATEDFISNPTPENADKVDQACENLTPEQTAEYAQWCIEKASEIDKAFDKIESDFDF